MKRLIVIRFLNITSHSFQRVIVSQFSSAILCSLMSPYKGLLTANR